MYVLGTILLLLEPLINILVQHCFNTLGSVRNQLYTLCLPTFVYLVLVSFYELHYLLKVPVVSSII